MAAWRESDVAVYSRHRSVFHIEKASYQRRDNLRRWSNHFVVESRDETTPVEREIRDMDLPESIAQG